MSSSLTLTHSVCIASLQLPQSRTQGGPSDSTSLLQKMLLTGTFLGTEMAPCFQQIYMLLSLQYLGLPLYLISLSGFIGGFGGLVLLPLIGSLVDKGDNPKRRKLYAILVSVLLLLTAYMLLVAACFCKLYDIDGIKAKQTNEIIPSELIQPISTRKPISIATNSTEDGWRQTNRPVKDGGITYTYDAFALTSLNGISGNKSEDDDVAKIPTSAILGVLGFSLIDIGFDVGTPLSRAFVLDSTVPAAHPQVLIVATLMASAGGILFALLGVFDISDMLEATFNVEGMTAMLFLISFFLTLVLIVSTCSTVFTSLKLNKDFGGNLSGVQNKTNPGSRVRVDSTSSLLGQDFSDDEETYLATENVKQPTYTMSYDQSDSENPQTDKNRFVSSFASSVAYTLSDISGQYDDVTEQENKTDAPTQNNKPSWVAERLGIQRQQSYFSSRVRQPVAPVKAPSFCSKKLAILCGSCFFGVFANTTFTMYTSNILTVGVYGGDPGAEGGSEKYDNFLKGQQSSALGTLVMFIAYLIATSLNKKLFQVIGERTYLVVCSLAMVTADILFLSFQTVPFYFLAMIVYGFFRTCVFTVPFVLANKYIQEEINARSEKTGVMTEAASSHVGKAMSLMGGMLPLANTLLSTVMGPLMESTGSPWVPLIFSCLSCFMSCLFILPMYFFK